MAGQRRGVATWICECSCSPETSGSPSSFEPRSRTWAATAPSEPSYDDASSTIDWADAAIIDLAGDGLDDLNRLRVEAPRVRILAVATEAAQEEAARSAGADQVLVEPFSIADVVEAVRRLGPSGGAVVVDLRTGERAPAPEVEDAPWWATR